MVTTVEGHQLLPACSQPLLSQALPSSSPLPSPSAVLREISRKASEKAAKSTDLWEIPDSEEGEAELSLAPESKARRKPVAKPTVPKAKGRQARVKVAIDVLSTRPTNTDVRNGVRSKYFVQELPKKAPRKTSTKEALIGKAHFTTTITTKTARKKVVGQSKSDIRMLAEAPLVLSQFRRQWTPVKAAVDLVTHQSPAANGNEMPPLSPSFATTIGTLKYISRSSEEQGGRAAGSVVPENGPILLRKRPIEVIELPNSRTGVTRIGPKPRKTKKQAQTITERASAQYRTNEPSPSPITKFFSASKKSTSASTNAKAPLNSLVPTKRKHNDDDGGSCLLSPASAKQRIDNQGFVFGTCSQLESESIGDGFCSSPPLFVGSTTARAASLRRITVAGAARSKGLWNAANRDLDGEILGLDTLDISNYERTTTRPSPPRRSENLPPPCPYGSQHLSGEADIEYREAPQKPVTIDLTLSSSPSPAPPAIISEYREPYTSQHNTPHVTFPSPHHSVPSIEIPVSVLVRPHKIPLDQLPAMPVPKRCFTTSSTTAAKRPRTKHPTTPPQLPTALEPEPTAEPTVNGPKMPGFSTYLTTRLQSELSNFGFKKIRSRAAMISTMEQLWKVQNAIPPPGEEGATPSVSEPALSRPRSQKTTNTKSRSRSNSIALGTINEEAALLERSRAASKVPEKAKKSSTVTRTKKSSVRSPEETRQLHVKISEAVKTKGNTNDFYLKILMYDPVIIEDLTAWLNTVGLKSVGINEEISVAESRQWCDHYGVCCLTKETQRGFERKRF